jgi:hypothetical protein
MMLIWEHVEASHGIANNILQSIVYWQVQMSQLLVYSLQHYYVFQRWVLDEIDLAKNRKVNKSITNFLSSIFRVFLPVHRLRVKSTTWSYFAQATDCESRFGGVLGHATWAVRVKAGLRPRSVATLLSFAHLVYENISVGNEIMWSTDQARRGRCHAEDWLSMQASRAVFRRAPYVIPQVMLFDNFYNIALLCSFDEWFRVKHVQGSGLRQVGYDGPI